MLQLDQDVEKGVLFWGYSPPNISWVTPSGGTIHRCIGASRYASCIDTHDGVSIWWTLLFRFAYLCSLHSLIRSTKWHFQSAILIGWRLTDSQLHFALLSLWWQTKLWLEFIRRPAVKILVLYGNVSAILFLLLKLAIFSVSVLWTMHV